MKKYISIFAIGIFSTAYSQVQTNGNTSNSLDNTNYFLDGSYFNGQADKSVGKLLGFPQTDLSTFEFKTQIAEDEVVTSFFDGVVVYNTKSGKTGANPDTQGIQVDIEPGFYYFYNPKGVDNQSVAEGKWVRIGGGASTSAAGANVATGTFTHAGGIKAVLGDNVPTDLKAITGIKIVRVDDNGAKLEGGVAATTFYSYDKATRTISFGQGVMATSMPKGEYRYTIEYTK